MRSLPPPSLRDELELTFSPLSSWVGGAFGVGKRCPLKYTRRIIDAIHDGSLAKAEFKENPVFKLAIPTAVEGIPSCVSCSLSPCRRRAAQQRD